MVQPNKELPVVSVVRQVAQPIVPGWYAFKGMCRTRGNQLMEYESVFHVERSYHGQMMVKTSASNLRPVSAFQGAWWKIDLPWEYIEQTLHENLEQGR